MSGRATSDLPFGSEFSPSQVNLRQLLQIAAAHPGGLAAIEAAIKTTWFAAHGGPDPAKAEKNRRTLAMNCRLGLQGYGLLDAGGNLTALGSDLHATTKDGDLYSAFARHILLNLNGMRLVECVRDMLAAGEDVTLEALEEALRLRGLKVAKISRHLSSMRLWLEQAGIFSGGKWQIDTFRLQAVLGTSPDDFTALADLSPAQRAFLRALANTGKTDPQPADGIKELAESVYGVSIPGKSFSGQVINPLHLKGWIVATKTTGGRGAKTSLVQPTTRVQAEIIEPFLEQLKDGVDAKLLTLLRKPLSDVLAEMKSADTYVAGLALEALAFKLMRLLDMAYVDTRVRGTQTGGAEVDLIFESARLVFSRWQVQCKNVKTGVRTDDVAKEVGLTHVLKSNVIVITTTGPVGGEARKYASQIMRQTNLAIVLLDGQDLNAINDDHTKIAAVFRREAEIAMRLKALTKDEVPSL